MSLVRLRECDTHDVRYVVRLKDDWKPTVDRLVRGTGFPKMARGQDFDSLLEDDVIIRDGNPIDADVTLGRGAVRVKSRMVGLATPKGYCFFLTNLPRTTHGPTDVGDIYRVRWEIEIDNKVDKAGAHSRDRGAQAGERPNPRPCFAAERGDCEDHHPVGECRHRRGEEEADRSGRARAASSHLPHALDGVRAANHPSLAARREE